jgi:hypothetical protein
MSKFWVTVFDDVFAKTLRGEDMTLVDLAELIQGTTAPSKNKLPLLKLARFGAKREPGSGSLRTDENVLSVSGVEGDYDGGEMPAADASARLDRINIAHLIYTTGNHTLLKPRWRVLAPFSQELPPGERDRMVDRLNGALGGVLSPESWTLSQAFYFGRIV